jgi:glycosyltransferase involved in cell wall biosynthesis
MLGATMRRGDGTAPGHQEAAAASQIQVRHFQRAPVRGWFSVENIFNGVRECLPEDIRVTLVVNRRPSRGLLPRLFDALQAWRQRSQVNHVLGDVHYLAWFLPRRRTVLTVLDCVSLEGRLKGLRRWLFWLAWYWWPLKRAGHITTISEFSRDTLLGWVRYPRERIAIIPPPLADGFTFAPPRPHDQWSRLLHIGSTANKNLARVIQAIAGMDVTLVIVGHVPDDQRRELERLNIRYENHYELDHEALVEQYRSADMLVFASTYEGFGMPIVEAQATGRPVVTSNICSMPEAAGGAACLVDPHDIESIRAGIGRVLGDAGYSARLIEAGLENAAKYTPGRIAARYAALYREIASEADR